MINRDQGFIPPSHYCMAMQRRRVEVVAKTKFDLCRTVFGVAGFARTGANRFRFGRCYSGAAGAATGCSVPGFVP